MTTFARIPMHDDFLDSLLSDCEPTCANDLLATGPSPFELGSSFPIASKPAVNPFLKKETQMYTSPSITPVGFAKSVSPTQTKATLDSGKVPPVMQLERAASPDAVHENPPSPKEESPKKRVFEVYAKEEKTAAKENPTPAKKRKQEDRRERKNQREKQRRTELNALFDNMVDLLGLPKESKADKVTVLASAINTIRQLRSTVRPELLQLAQDRNLFNVPVSETVDLVKKTMKRQQEMESAQVVKVVPPVVSAPPLRHQESAPMPSSIPSIDDLTFFDPGSVFADM